MSTATVVDAPEFYTAYPRKGKASNEAKDVAQRLQVIVAKLAEFDTIGGVADFIRNQGITGVPGDSRRCPLSRLIQQAIGYPAVRVSANISVAMPSGGYLLMATPEILRAFFRAFDQDKFPELLEPANPW